MRRDARIPSYWCGLERFLIVVAMRGRAARRWTDWDRQDKCLARGIYVRLDMTGRPTSLVRLCQRVLQRVYEGRFSHTTVFVSFVA